MLSKKMYRLKYVLAVIMILVSSGGAFAAGEKAKILTEILQPDIPQAQGFCGYCHILTYPRIVNKAYETWKKDKHNKYSCAECHYPPWGAKRSSQTPAAGGKAENKHIPNKPPGRFSYLRLGGETVQLRPRITDVSCMTANCHGKPDDKFKTKKIKFTEKVPFIHESHLLKKNQIEGMQVNCTTCHQHESEVKHFQVAEASCHLCHFTNVKFNQGRGKCELCHELPKKPIQTSGEKPITHIMLKTANVPCYSCHIEVIQNSGRREYEVYFEDDELKTVLVLGAGRIKNENCRACHDQVKDLKENNNKKLMHQKHVSIKHARCLECHQPILHAKADLSQPMRDQTVRNGCTACHSDHHRYQRLLAAGPERGDIPALPDPMFKAGSNCLACHVEKQLTHKGQIVMRASAKTCVQCHTKDYEKMLGMWKRELAQEVEKAQKLEKEALEVLAEYKPELTQEKLTEARNMFMEGRENLGIAQFGNGVHNAKYSISLLDAAISSFKNMIGYLEGKDISEDLVEEE